MTPLRNKQTFFCESLFLNKWLLLKELLLKNTKIYPKRKFIYFQKICWFILKITDNLPIPGFINNSNYVNFVVSSSSSCFSVWFSKTFSVFLLNCFVLNCTLCSSDSEAACNLFTASGWDKTVKQITNRFESVSIWVQMTSF